jgi:hypothetical protein
MAKEPAAPDVYVSLLFVSAAALTIGCIFLGLELARYGWTFQ